MIEQIHLKFVAAASRHSKRTVIIISTLFLCLLCLLDYITGDYSLIIFYLIPVSFTAWFIGKKTGVFFCALSLLARITADFTSSGTTQRSSLHYWNLFIEFSFLVVMSLLFSALKNKLDSEKELARIDPLTKTINRRSFFDLAEQEINRARRYEHPFTIAYIDLDNFKEINDQHGHSTGDKLLITVVNTINAHIRSTDILARFGGDEFVILLPETTGESARSTLDKLQLKLMEAMSRNFWPVTFSVGAASYLNPPTSVEEAVRSADALMYEVKRSGKNRLLHSTFD
ncbi:MAG: GGDEF domain-containing protein [Desulfuromonadales bacterium]|nr:GGDEF domain-containing protein [Desulfuromonadales bacterium]